MGKIVEELEYQVRHSSKNDFRKVFVEYCVELIKQKEIGNFSIEQVGYRIVCVFLPDRYEEVKGDVKGIFDVAFEMEIPRTQSYKQRIDEWNEKVANKIKEEEWKEFLTLVVSLTHSEREKE